MSTGFIIKGIFILAAVILAAVIVKIIVTAVRRTVNRAETHIVKELFDAAASQNFQFDSAPAGPKKVSNMNKIYLPMIEKDFPNFSWVDTKQLIEQEIQARYAKKHGLTFYETAVSRYEKSGGSITLTAESSVSCDENGSKQYFIVQTTLAYLRTGTTDGTAQGEHALNCPNCSAPLKRNAAGELLCEYCGTLVSGEKTWQITDIREA